MSTTFESSIGAGLAPLTTIYVPADRMREDTPSVRRYIDEELCPSIQEFGLIQPIVLRQFDEPFAADGTTYDYELIAGWCRLQACKAIGLLEVPYAFRKNLRADQLAELELEENLRRKDFTWQEVCLGIYTTHRSKKLNAMADGTNWGVRQTGALLKKSFGHVNDCIKVAEALLANNEPVKSAASLSQAMQALAGQREDAAVSMLAKLSGGVAKPKLNNPTMGPVTPGSTPGIDISALIGASPSGSPSERVSTLPQTVENTIEYDLSKMLFNMDNRTWFDAQPDNSIDLIYTDIPFGIDMDNLDFGAADLDRVAGAHDVDENLEQMPVFINNAYRTLKDQSYLLFWYDICHHEKLLGWLKSAGFTVQPYPLVWCKEHPCKNRAAGQWWTKAIEYVMVARKGTATLRAPQNRNWYIASGSAERKMQRNPFAKPFEVSKQILDAIVVPGMTMVDPYAGEGSLIRAGLNMGLRVKGIEKETTHYNGLVEHVKQTCTSICQGRASFTWGGEPQAVVEEADSILF